MDMIVLLLLACAGHRRTHCSKLPQPSGVKGRLVSCVGVLTRLSPPRKFAGNLRAPGPYLLINHPRSAVRAICIPRYVAASISARTNEGEAAASGVRLRVQRYCLSGFYGLTDLRS
jgi:hypothetical protein